MKGRPKNPDPNVIHSYTIGIPYIPPLPANLRAKRKGGKVPLTVYVPPELYEDLRKEALNTNQTMSKVVVECISAGREIE